MGMNSYPVTHYQLDEKILGLVKDKVERFEYEAARIGVSVRGLAQYFSCDGDIDGLIEGIEEGADTSIQELYDLPIEDLPAQLTNDKLLPCQKLLVKERLEGLEDDKLKAITKEMAKEANPSYEPLAEYLASRLEAIVKDMGEVIGIQVYCYTDEDGSELYWGVEHSELFVPSPAHQALINNNNRNVVVWDHSWAEWG